MQEWTQDDISGDLYKEHNEHLRFSPLSTIIFLCMLKKHALFLQQEEIQILLWNCNMAKESSKPALLYYGSTYYCLFILIDIV